MRGRERERKKEERVKERDIKEGREEALERIIYLERRRPRQKDSNG